MLSRLSAAIVALGVAISAPAQLDRPNPDAQRVLRSAVALWEMNGLGDSGQGTAQPLRPIAAVRESIRLEAAERSASFDVGGDGVVSALEPGAFIAGQPTSGKVNLTGEAFTFLVRIKKTGGTWNTTLFSKHGGHNKLQYNLFAFEGSNGSLDLGLEAGTESGFAKASASIRSHHAEGWLDLLGRYDGRHLELFVNGEREARVPLTGRLRPPSGAPLVVAGEWNGRTAARRLTGLVDHAALWDRALSDEEVDLVTNRWGGPLGSEPYRPALRFTPERNWINDPNGMMYVDGTWHLFYQYNPFGQRWGNIGWGHATSNDLINWTHMPVAIPEEDGVMSFSGSAVHDVHNTSGFGTNGKGPLVAIYTGHNPSTQRQDQRLAYSNDGGVTWTKYADNPVIDLDARHHRDPKVFWHDETSRWIMVVSVATSYKVQFWGSDDLKSWELLSEFGPAGASEVPNWECPELFELPVENRPGESRWVLQIDIGANGPVGGSAGQYFVGHFDGTRFVNENPPETTLWVDYGADFYAAQSFTGVPGRRVWLAWMNDWRYANDIPTYPWRGAMTLPREVGLRETPAGIRLFQRPAAEIDRAFATTLASLEDAVVTPKSDPLDGMGIRADVARVRVTFEVPDRHDRFGVRVFEGVQEHTTVGYDLRLRELFVDRRNSGEVDFHEGFAQHHAAPMAIGEDGTVTLDIIIDRSSVEVFGQQGEAVISDQVFPSPKSRSISLFSERGPVTIRSMEILGR